MKKFRNPFKVSPVLGVFFWGMALAGPGLDLVAQHERYGFEGVAMIVGQYERSETAAGEIQAVLSAAGLSKLTLPMAVDPTLKEVVLSHGVVGQCAWQWGVYCQAPVSWVAGLSEPWVVRCVKGGQVLGAVSLGVVRLPKREGQPDAVQIGGMHRCWAAGGDSVRLSAK